MAQVNLLEDFLKIIGNTTNTLFNLITYKVDLSSIGLGEVSLLILFSGGALLSFLVYKVVKWLL